MSNQNKAKMSSQSKASDSANIGSGPADIGSGTPDTGSGTASIGSGTTPLPPSPPPPPPPPGSEVDDELNQTDGAVNTGGVWGRPRRRQN